MTKQDNQQQELREYYPQQRYVNDEIDLRELFGVLWAGKWWIILITALFAIASVVYALSLPNEYKATAIVAPASGQGGGGLNALAGQLGGLASIAGVNLGSPETTDAVVAMELMKTWGFADEFIKRHSLQVPLFAAIGWNASKEEFIFDEKLYDIEAGKWIREAPKGKTSEPTSWELFGVFTKGLTVTQNKETGLIVVGFMSYSPEYAQRITQWLIEDVNSKMKERALKDASNNIDYLEQQINKTPLSDMQNVFYSLIQEQTKSKMLAEASDEYVFKTISSALVPEVKTRPGRAMICILGVLLGGFLSLIFVLVKNAFWGES